MLGVLANRKPQRMARCRQIGGLLMLNDPTDGIVADLPRGQAGAAAPPHLGDGSTLDKQREPEAKKDTEACCIRNEKFIQNLDQIREIKGFLFEEKVSIKPQDVTQIDLGALNNLIYGRQGRLPTPSEWRILDEKLSVLTSYLDPTLKRKIRIRELDFFFGPLPLVLLLLTAITTVTYFTYTYLLKSGSAISAFTFVAVLIVWTVCQGALGACAFLGTSVTSARAVNKPTGDNQPTETPIDITDLNVLKIRVVSGALFAFLVGLPFAYQALNALQTAFFGPDPQNQVSGSANPSTILSGISWVVFVPFIVGFSTNFVLAVLDRVIEALRSLLGMASHT
jgi:hypothetical protein